MAESPTASIGILTVSDRASRGEYEDRGGPAIEAYLEEVLASAWRAVTRVVPDELPLVCAALKTLADEEDCCLIITTGGTGPAPRDITPEATTAVRPLPDHQSARPATCHQSVSGRRLSGGSLLHRPDRRSVSDNQTGAARGVSTGHEMTGVLRALSGSDAAT